MELERRPTELLWKIQQTVPWNLPVGNAQFLTMNELRQRYKYKAKMIGFMYDNKNKMEHGDIQFNQEQIDRSPPKSSVASIPIKYESTKHHQLIDSSGFDIRKYPEISDKLNDKISFKYYNNKKLPNTYHDSIQQLQSPSKSGDHLQNQATFKAVTTEKAKHGIFDDANCAKSSEVEHSSNHNNNDRQILWYEDLASWFHQSPLSDYHEESAELRKLKNYLDDYI